MGVAGVLQPTVTQAPSAVLLGQRAYSVTQINTSQPPRYPPGTLVHFFLQAPSTLNYRILTSLFHFRFRHPDVEVKRDLLFFFLAAFAFLFRDNILKFLDASSKLPFCLLVNKLKTSHETFLGSALTIIIGDGDEIIRLGSSSVQTRSAKARQIQLLYGEVYGIKNGYRNDGHDAGTNRGTHGRPLMYGVTLDFADPHSGEPD